jgi:hypothetical protein
MLATRMDLIPTFENAERSFSILQYVFMVWHLTHSNSLLYSMLKHETNLTHKHFCLTYFSAKLLINTYTLQIQITQSINWVLDDPCYTNKTSEFQCQGSTERKAIWILSNTFTCISKETKN